ncbi:MAG: filamentous hemagglutinin family protein [Chthoniobacterales bacterium]
MPLSGVIGDVIVERGATISTTEGAGGNGGRVMLVGPKVRNEGTISTPSGQTILAAGLQVGVQAHNGSDPSLRGLDVWVGNIGSYEGSATNTGIIEAPHGSILMTGRYVNQQGILESSTSVNLNGRIDLLANYGAVANPNYDNTAVIGGGGPIFLSQFTGSVTLGDGSVTRILPDYASDKMVPGTSLAEVSQVNMQGLSIYFARNSILLAPGADVNLNAGTWTYKDPDGNRTVLDAFDAPEAGLGNHFTGSTQKFLFSGGQVYLDAGALIDVSGSTNVFVKLDQHILSVQLRGSELADSPLQRSSGIRGIGLIVDIRRSGTYGGRQWVGTPLGDLTGLAGIIEHDVAQLTAAGGNVNIKAGDSIVVQAGATVDVSGGYFRNEAGMVQTSRLMRNGNLVNIDNATPDVIYGGIYDGLHIETSQKWGVNKVFSNPLAPLGAHYQAEYIEGASGGSINLTAPGIVLAGQLTGQTVQGPKQLDLPAQMSSLALSFRNEKQLFTSLVDFKVINSSPTPPNITFTSGGTNVAVPVFTLVGDVPTALPASLTGNFLVSTDLYDKEKSGFGHLEIDNRDGNLLVPHGTRLNLPAGGSLVARAANITILDDIIAPGGAIELTAYNFSPFLYEEIKDSLATLPPLLPVAGRGMVNVAEGVRISAAGMMIDDRPTSSSVFTEHRALDGGTVLLEGYTVRLGEGSLVTASGGIQGNFNGKFKYGNGGDISILAGKDPDISSIIGGMLRLEGELESYSVTQGGALSIQANLIQIGGASSDSDALLLQPEFFTKGGFTKYSLTGIGKRNADGSYVPAVLLTAGTEIRPISKNWIINARGKNNFSVLPILKPIGIRPATSLELIAIGADDPFLLNPAANFIDAMGLAVLEGGSRIITDPGASVSIKGDSVAVLGSIRAPGGIIQIAGAGKFRQPDALESSATLALPTVYIGSGAMLSAAGTSVLLPDSYGRRNGIVYAGGVIKVSGNIVADSGAVLDVSGASAVLDVHPSRLAQGSKGVVVPASSGLNSMPWGRASVPVRVESDGGLIDLQGSQMLYSDATLLGKAGGSTALGGTLSISSGRFYVKDVDRTAADINLIVEQSGNAGNFGALGSLGNIMNVMNGKTDLAALYTAGSVNPGIGYFSIDQFTQGGFDSLDLGYKYFVASPISYGGNVDFRGPVSINARGFVRIAGGGIIQANAPVNIQASYASIGKKFRDPVNPNDIVHEFEEYITQSIKDYAVEPTFGPGFLSLNASLIDVGTSVFKNIGRVALNASGGDIRGNGTLSIRGDLTLNAAQIYPTTLATFNIFAYDPVGRTGSVTITGSGVRPPPLSAGGSLNIFASTINQGGTLRAPLGSITLGWDGTDFDLSDADMDTPFNPATRAALATPIANIVTLQSGSVISISGINPLDGSELLIPYGLSADGLSWIDPRGVNITASGLPAKRISVAGNSVIMEADSTIDIRGGGDLLAFRWVPGTGGSNDLLGTASADWSAQANYSAGDLVSFGGKTWTARVSINAGNFVNAPNPKVGRYWSLVSESYAVIPGFGSQFAPINGFNVGSNAGLLGGDLGYTSGLSTGAQVYLDASSGLPAGVYTLLPRRYALMPGAFLVTPQNEGNRGSATLTGSSNYLSQDGASYVSGYTFNFFNKPAVQSALRTQYEVVPSSVLAERVSYDRYTANEFLSTAASRLDIADVQRLPGDSGALTFQGVNTLRLNGNVYSSAGKGQGASIDISSTADMYISGEGIAAPPGAAVVLNSSRLSSWGAESLLIGGLRRDTADGTVVDVKTRSLTLDNPGGALSGSDIILASREQLTMTAGSALISTGSPTQSADNLLIAGDGSLLRVSGDSEASVTRSGLTGSALPLLTIGSGAKIAGRSVILDSTFASNVHSSADVEAYAFTLGSGQISILLDPQTLPLAGATVASHLILTGNLKEQAGRATLLTLLSYRSIDIYGTGTFGGDSIERLNLLGGGIRGFGQGSGTASIQAKNILFSNPSNIGVPATPPGAPSGNLAINSGTLRLGLNAVNISGYQNVALNTTGGILAESTGSLTTVGNLTVTTPLITGAKGVNQSITAGGVLTLLGSGGPATVTGGLGATLAFQGTSVSAASNIYLPSGALTLRATTGNLTVDGKLSVEGTEQEFYDLTRYTDAGKIQLIADAGNVTLSAQSAVSVAAHSGGGNAGTMIVKTAQNFSALGAFDGQGGSSGIGGSFELDAGNLASFDTLTQLLNAGGFTESRNLRIRNGDITVSGVTTVRDFALSTDSGSILVTGSVDAGGRTGGKIFLSARNNVVLANTANLSVHGQLFDSAGKGGEVSIEAGATGAAGTANLGGFVTIGAGSTIDLGVDAYVPGLYTDPAASAFYGQFTGKLHLRAPRVGTSVNVNSLQGNIIDPSSVIVEGFKVYDRTAAGGVMDATLRNTMNTDNIAFMVGEAAMRTNLLLGSVNPSALGNALVISPGVEIINRTGDLVLGLPGNANGTAPANDWNLATYRYGAKGAPGILTLRAAGNLVFQNALSDGFAGFTTTQGTPTVGRQLWLADLMAINPLLPVNTQSWSYRLTAGADFGAADFRAVKSLDSLGADSGSLLLGNYYNATLVTTTGANATTAIAISPDGNVSRFQVIRTGAGDIQITAGRDVRLRNQFATIYTAGVRLPNPTQIFAPGDFSVPLVERTTSNHPDQTGLGAVQQTYPAQWAMAGGNVDITAQADIRRVTLVSNVLVNDTSRQIPTNWLYRRSYVDGAGDFGVAGVDAGVIGTGINDPSASTAWWIDYSNFFQGVGALGGGDVHLNAGRNIINVDAVAPTNARMAGKDSLGNRIAPNEALFLELGGGDISVRAGNNIDGGMYYVERGNGTLIAGNEITTNSSRAPSLGIINTNQAVADPLTWLPTTLFLGRGTFNVTALGNVLLGPVANPSLLPQGLNNKFWYKTYFNTYGEDSEVNVSSFGGSITHRLSVVTGTGSAKNTLQTWIEAQNLFGTGATRGSNTQPWIRLNETSITPFATALAISAPTLRSTAFSGDVNIIGTLNLFPSATGTVELAASGSVIGLNRNGRTTATSSVPSVVTWSTARINLSDADPQAIPGITSPFTYQSLVGRAPLALRATQQNFLNNALDIYFNETGSSGSAVSIQTKQALHDAIPLHLNDPNPVRIYGLNGDITGLTLYSSKAAQLVAARDISDISFYIQNINAEDVSFVTAGRDIIPYNENTALRSLASDLSRGNAIKDIPVPTALKNDGIAVTTNVLAGDIQINGPGLLEVLAGRNLDLGTGPNRADGTGIGITSIGAARNPFLSANGADIIAMAGVSGRGEKAAFGLGESSLNFDGLIAGNTGGSLTGERRFADLVQSFFEILRQSADEFKETGDYASGYAAVEALFGNTSSTGEIFTRSRDIRTTSGGSIVLAAPQGGLIMASDIFGNPLTPPGIVTEYGGSVSIFTKGDINIGQARIFTLRGGDMTIWSSEGDIAAGTAPKTVVTAPPTRVLIDTTSADVQTDLGGLATGGGIGVLASVEGVEEGSVFLIAPKGTVDAGDAGIRATGDITIAAVTVLNADNISAGGSTVGVPTTPTVAAPNIGGLSAASSSTGATNSAATQVANQARPQAQEDSPSVITVEVLGYGGEDNGEG